MDIGLGGRFRKYHIHHSNDLILGPAIRTLQPLHLATVAIGDSTHGIRGGAGPAPNARYEVHSTPLSLRPLASHNHQAPQYPQNAALSAAEEEAPSFLLSKGDPATTCVRPSPGAAADVGAKIRRDLAAATVGDTGFATTPKRTHAPCSSAPTLGGVHVCERRQLCRSEHLVRLHALTAQIVEAAAP